MLRYPQGFFGWRGEHRGEEEGTGTRPALKPGDRFPECRLAVLDGQHDREYLGLAPQARYLSLADLDVPYVVVVFFNSRCSECVKEVKVFNGFYERLRLDPELSGTIKVLGLGMLDSKRTVVRFRKREGIAFPLFSDEKRMVFDCLGQAAVPVAYVLRRLEHGEREIVRVRPGAILENDPFFEQIERLGYEAVGSGP